MDVDGASFLFMCRRFGGENAVQNLCSTTNIIAARMIKLMVMGEYNPDI